MSQTAVIIPTYNRADLLEQTLRSVYAQVPRPAEIIVVDDGSTDGTAELVRRAHPAVTYLWQPNQYQGAARETGRRASRAPLLLFLDSDDLLLPGAVATLEAALDADPAAPLAHGPDVPFVDDGPCGLPALPDVPYGRETFHLVTANHIRTPGCALVRRSALDAAGIWDTSLRGIEDWDMWLRLSLVGPFARVDRPVLRYRVHPQNISQSAPVMHRSYLNFVLKHSDRSSVVRRHDRRAWKQFRRDRRAVLPLYLEQVRAGVESPPASVRRRIRAEHARNRVLYCPAFLSAYQVVRRFREGRRAGGVGAS